MLSCDRFVVVSYSLFNIFFFSFFLSFFLFFLSSSSLPFFDTPSFAHIIQLDSPARTPLLQATAMDDLNSPHSHQSIEHHRSDGSVPASDPGVSSRTRASNVNSPIWASTGNLHHNDSPEKHQEEMERGHEAEVVLVSSPNQQHKLTIGI